MSKGAQAWTRRDWMLMFVDVIRRYLETLPPERLDWLAGLRDPHIGRALAEIHRDPARHWTLASLAHTVALSRSAFAEHFMKFVGTPPMQYLTNWRMQIAANQLLSTRRCYRGRESYRLRFRGCIQPRATCL
jgi:AraC-like DNA-binding protein